MAARRPSGRAGGPPRARRAGGAAAPAVPVVPPRPPCPSCRRGRRSGRSRGRLVPAVPVVRPCSSCRRCRSSPPFRSCRRCRSCPRCRWCRRAGPRGAGGPRAAGRPAGARAATARSRPATSLPAQAPNVAAIPRIGRRSPETSVSTNAAGVSSSVHVLERHTPWKIGFGRTEVDEHPSRAGGVRPPGHRCGARPQLKTVCTRLTRASRRARLRRVRARASGARKKIAARPYRRFCARREARVLSRRAAPRSDRQAALLHPVLAHRGGAAAGILSGTHLFAHTACSCWLLVVAALAHALAARARGRHRRRDPLRPRLRRPVDGPRDAALAALRVALPGVSVQKSRPASDDDPEPRHAGRRAAGAAILLWDWCAGAAQPNGNLTAERRSERRARRWRSEECRHAGIAEFGDFFADGSAAFERRARPKSCSRCDRSYAHPIVRLSGTESANNKEGIETMFFRTIRFRCCSIM